MRQFYLTYPKSQTLYEQFKKLYLKMPEQKSDFNRLFIELYPDIYYER